MAVLPRNWAIWLANLLIPVAILVFSSGFFPYKPLLPGLATFEETNGTSRPPAIFDKVIFMVVDALRSDFVFSSNSGFAFAQSLIRSGAALPFTAHASSPTVTMPRLKAITTGSVPSFLDVILNIAESDTSSTLAYQDTWLAQLKARDDKLVMYGDDTWLKLFPGMFDRADGTTSFFVSDFTEVDNNVTRHIPKELQHSDWSALIMHYLGLDHIGHKAGPKSPYMMSKQQEMDSIVSQVYSAIEQEEHLQSTLFVLCGDHGMNDAGNHGGSSAGETSAALLFVSPKFKARGVQKESPVEATNELQYYRTIEQTDITPTLAGLLGLPIPLNSLGVFIPEFLVMWDHGFERVHILMENAKQLLRTIKATFPSYTFESSAIRSTCESGLPTDMEEAQCAWSQVHELLHESNTDEIPSSIQAALLRFLRISQNVMSSTAGNYDLQRLYLGIFAAGVAALLSFPATYRLLARSHYSGSFLLFSIFGYSAMMFASSYVEEEQQFWYWIFTGWIFYLHIKSNGYQGKRVTSDHKLKGGRQLLSLFSAAGTIGLGITYRILRRWNQTGQKFAAEPDIARAFFSAHQDTLWFLVILTYANTYKHLLISSPSSLVWRLVSLFATIAAFIFKLTFVASDSPELLGESFLGPLANTVSHVSLVLQARIVFCGVALMVLYAMVTRSGTLRVSDKHKAPNAMFHEALTLFLITQSRATNVPLFLIFRIQFYILASMDITGIESSITSILSQYMTFFAFGGSNAISSVDLSSAYNGIGSYSVILVGLLTFVGNWAGPIWWVSATRLLRTSRTWTEKQGHVSLLTFHATTALLSVMAACTALRTHLFIWTVFSPKFLYTMAWATLNHIVINVLGDIDLLAR